MQLKNETQTGFSAEMQIIPPWAWTLALIAVAGGQVFFNLVMAGQADAPPVWARILLGVLAGMFLGAYFLLIGYISRDARRRGMSALLWTLIAILIPNCLGIILYFILRQSRTKKCPQCGNNARTEFNFCPRCSCKLSASCPQCQREVGVDDVYCPHCGTSLRKQGAPDYVAGPEAFK